MLKVLVVGYKVDIIQCMSDIGVHLLALSRTGQLQFGYGRGTGITTGCVERVSK